MISVPDYEDVQESHLRRALEAAVRGGNDTDTVAAIAGALLGAKHGGSAVPTEWRDILHGWPGKRAGDLIEAGYLIAALGETDSNGGSAGREMTDSNKPRESG